MEVLIDRIFAPFICDDRKVTSEATPTAGRTAGSLALLVAASLIFSTGGLFVRSVHTDNPWTIVFWRSFSACISIVVFMLISDRRGALRSIRSMGVPGLLVGASFCVSSISMVAALSRTSVAVTLVILALTPLAAALLARVFIGETVHGYTWAAIAATVAGVAYMVSGPGANVNAVGVLISLLIPITFGIGIIVIRKHPGIG
ncbi:MAG: DMT family transporter, partial [Acidobacteria bacterium]|nr:DMT family transporter [Acidobacteriota bacterium]